MCILLESHLTQVMRERELGSAETTVLAFLLSFWRGGVTSNIQKRGSSPFSVCELYEDRCGDSYIIHTM